MEVLVLCASVPEDHLWGCLAGLWDFHGSEGVVQWSPTLDQPCSPFPFSIGCSCVEGAFSSASAMKFSLRFWFLSTAFLLVFIMSLLFTYSHHSIAYLDLGGLNGLHRVKLVPSYAGMQRLSKEGLLVKSCACHRCTMESSDTAWFDSRFDGNISPVWTKENVDLPLDVQRWWMVSPVGSLPRQKQLLNSCTQTHTASSF